MLISNGYAQTASVRIDNLSPFTERIGAQREQNGDRGGHGDSGNQTK
jgi:hypothetical protein